jgi:hypothetical protein
MRRPTGKSRKAVTLSKPLHRDLTLYALAASAAGVSVLVLSQPAEAQIVYTPAHEGIGRNGRMLIDLNHDEIPDVVIREIPWSEGPGFSGNSLQAVPRGGGGFRLGGYTEFAAAMAPGSKIGASDLFFAGAAVMVQATSYGGYFYGSWSPQATNGYLGIRFRIDGETHYGWARLNVKINFETKQIDAFLTGYAYETEPNVPILAGDTGENDADPGAAKQMTVPLEPEEKRQSTLGALALGTSNISDWRSGDLLEGRQ